MCINNITAISLRVEIYGKTNANLRKQSILKGKCFCFIHPPAGKVSREVSNLTGRKHPHEVV